MQTFTEIVNQVRPYIFCIAIASADIKYDYVVNL